MAVGKNMFSATKWGAGGIIRFVQKNWYWFIFILIIIPTVFSSVKVAIETGNPSYPFVQFGLHITNADAIIYDDVQILKTNPIDLIGMEKPSQGIWKHAVYYWHIFKVIWKELGLVWLITFPFVIIFKVIRLKNISEVSKNVLKSIMYGLIFIFVMNLTLTLFKVIDGSIAYEFPAEIGQYEKIWLVILTTLPFHGIASLIIYLIGLLR